MSVAKTNVIAEKGMSFDIVAKTRLFPPLDVLNSFLQCGIDDAASEVSIQWEPFALTESEYASFFELYSKRVGELTIDKLGTSSYSEWFSQAAIMKPDT